MAKFVQFETDTGDVATINADNVLLLEQGSMLSETIIIIIPNQVQNRFVVKLPIDQVIKELEA